MGQEGIHSLPIHTMIRILKIGLIDTSSMVVGLTIEVTMRWKDNRLLYANLNREGENRVPAKTTQHLWLPFDHVIHANAIIGEVAQDPNTEVVIQRYTDPLDLTDSLGTLSTVLEDWKTHMEDFLYKGKDNYLEMKQRFRNNYDCTFDVTKFPFDQPKCNFILKLKVADNVSFSFLGDRHGAIYMGPTSVDQFEVQEISTTISNTATLSSFIFTLKMKRDYKHALLTKLFPTFLLWLLAYFSLLIRVDDFTNRFMGSVTALLVFTTLLETIYDQIPRTSYLRFIDIWVIWYLTNIFFICIFHIVLDMGFNIKDGIAETTSNNINPRLFQSRTCINESLQQENNQEENVKKRKKRWIIINQITQIICPIATIIFNVIYFIYSSN